MKFPVLWLSFSLAKCGRLGMTMFVKRLVVYEATYAKKATSQKGTLPSARLGKDTSQHKCGSACRQVR